MAERALMGHRTLDAADSLLYGQMLPPYRRIAILMMSDRWYNGAVVVASSCLAGVSSRFDASSQELFSFLRQRGVSRRHVLGPVCRS